MAEKFRIEVLGEASNLDLTMFPDWDAHPLQADFGDRLYRAVMGDAHKSHHFALIGADGPLILVRCTSGQEKISFYGMPLVLACRRALEDKTRRAVLAAVLDHLHDLAKSQGISEILVQGGSLPDPTILDCLCIDRQAKGGAQNFALMDLSLEVDALRRDIRDSYRSLINWGGRQIRMEQVNRSNPNRQFFERYVQFHGVVSGGKRDSRDYWRIYWDEIVAGRAELSLGWLAGDQLVSGTLVVEAGQTAYYASGVYDRDEFDKPLGHFPLWQAILRAKERGLRWFDLGELFAYCEGSDKERNIAFFKRGFTSRRSSRLVWSLKV